MPDPCPKCGSPRSEAGLCPRCLMGNALASDADITYSFQPNDPARVLETLAKTVGPMPRLLLPETAGSLDESPFVKPSSPEMPAQADRSSKVQLLGEIARGGMGAVLKGRDPDLGRDLAVKVLLETHRGNPDLIRRFVEEAQIGGQLQHPGIVPVYELGTFGDARPYFTMKLVKGRTLADLLGSRKDPSSELSKFLGIFEQIAQTVAYAYARGVIHRDLKPSNVMVGSFGEVQVMDWGLAKVLPKGGAVDDASAGKIEVHETVIATARSGTDDSDLSRAGSVMGTPSYMAPEQARGEIHRIDERADVFALGSILCEILTGQPAFVGRSSGEILRKAALGDLADAFSRLETSTIDAELLQLTRDCLAREPEDRLKDAGIVAERLGAYLAEVQARLRRAEIASVEERGRRRLVTAIAAGLLLVTTLGGSGVLYFVQQRAARAAVIAKVLGEVTTRHELARANPEDVAGWQTALSAARQAESIASGSPEELRQLNVLRDSIQAGADAAERDKTLLDRLVDIRSAKGDDLEGSLTDADYADAFRNAGLDVDRLTPSVAGEKIKARPLAVAQTIAAALDDWAWVRIGHQSDQPGADRLAEVARLADRDPWRNQLRDLLAIKSKTNFREALKNLAKTAKFDDLGPISLHQLGSILNTRGEKSLAESVLRNAQQRYPQDVWLSFELGKVLAEQSRFDEAIRFYTAARSIRPETAHELADALVGRGNPDEALAIFRDLTNSRPGNVRHLACLGAALKSKGLTEEASKVLEAAVAAGRDTIRLRPNSFIPHICLGNALMGQGKIDEAIAEHRAAIRLRPDSAVAHSNLGTALRDLGKLDEAIAEYREAIRHSPDLATLYFNLGGALCDQGKYDEAVTAYRQGSQVNPYGAENHNRFGIALYSLRRLDEAIVEYREAIRLKPDYADYHLNMGIALYDQGKLDEAIVEYRVAIRLKPDYAGYHQNLGMALYDQGKLDEAIVEYREAIRLKQDYAEAYCNLAQIFQTQGDYAGSLAMFRRGHELGSRKPNWSYPSAQWLAEAERLAALAERLLAILKGEAQPMDNEERLAMAQMLYDTKRFAFSTRFSAEAFAVDPNSGDDLGKGYRYKGACSAILASSGNGTDNPKPDEEARAKLRRQGLDWLKADLALRLAAIGSGKPEEAIDAREKLQIWKDDSDLASVRDPEPLAKLPEAERKQWQALWAEVDALIAGSSKP